MQRKRRTLTVEAVVPVDLAIVEEVADDGSDAGSVDAGGNVLAVVAGATSCQCCQGVGRVEQGITYTLWAK